MGFPLSLYTLGLFNFGDGERNTSVCLDLGVVGGNSLILALGDNDIGFSE